MEAIKQPSTKKEVELIVGSIKQLYSWSGQTTNLTTNMRQLICKDTHFRWTPQHEKEWLKVKKILQELSHVTPFRMGDNVEVYCPLQRWGYHTSWSSSGMVRGSSSPADQ